MMAAKGSIGKVVDQEIIVVDVAEENEMDFIREAGQVPRELVSNWQGPVRAVSSRTGGKRLCYT